MSYEVSISTNEESDLIKEPESTTNISSFRLNNLLPSKVYSFTVRCIDRNGLFSEPSEPLNVITGKSNFNKIWIIKIIYI